MGQFTKPTRYKSKRNLGLVRNMPCIVCLRRPADADHIRTVGSGGGDNLSNLQPLCREHHVERHTRGIDTFLSTYLTLIVERRKEFNLPAMRLREGAN